MDHLSSHFGNHWLTTSINCSADRLGLVFKFFDGIVTVLKQLLYPPVVTDNHTSTVACFMFLTF